MTKKRKLAVIFGASAALLCAVLVLIWRIATLPPSGVWRDPIETEALLPEPDTVVFYHGEDKYTLTKDTQAALYQTLSRWVAGAKTCTHTEAKQPNKLPAVRFELCYNGPYQYVGSLGTEEPLCAEPFVYTSLSLGWEVSDDRVSGLHMVLTPCHDGEYFGIDNKKTVLGLDLNAYGDEFDDLLVKALLNTREANDGEVLVESSIFPAKPDHAVLHRDGKTVALSQAELDAVYEAFMNTSGRWLSANRTVYVSGYGALQAMEHTVIEFRYDKRQKYLPIAIPESKNNGETVPVESAYNGREYDAFLLIVQESDAATQTLGMEVGLYVNGEYDFSRMRKWPWYIEKDFMEEICRIDDSK
ncbi:MAG: hypothetical protein IJW51_05065 [Clostridia bacterium]|nr:hypothetical protein [Clostridia bacterium]